MIVIHDADELLDMVNRRLMKTEVSEWINAKTFIDLVAYLYPNPCRHLWDELCSLYPDGYRKVSMEDHGVIEELYIEVQNEIEVMITESINIACGEGNRRSDWLDGSIDGSRFVIRLRD